MRRALPALLAVLCLCTGAQGGAWVPARGAYFLKLAPSFLSTAEEFDHRGRERLIQEEQTASTDARFCDLSLSAYLEYGLGRRAALVARLPFKVLRSERVLLPGGGLVRQRERLHSMGLGDLSVSLRRAVLVRPVALSFETGLKIPTGYDGSPADGAPPLGTGAVDGEVHLLLGRSLYPLPFYASASLGYRRRGGRLRDEVLYAGEVGYTFGPHLLKFGLDGIENTGAPPDLVGRAVLTPLPGGGGAVPDRVVGDQNVLKFNPTLFYEVRPGLTFMVEVLHVFSGANTLSGTVLSVGVVLRGEPQRVRVQN